MNVFFVLCSSYTDVHFVIKHWAVKSCFVQFSTFVVFHSKKKLNRRLSEANKYYLSTYYMLGHMTNTRDPKINEKGCFPQGHHESRD